MGTSFLYLEETFPIPVLQAMNKCNFFQNNPGLLGSPYQVQFPVSLSIFHEFISALEGNAIKITNTILTELDRLCDAFGFSELAAKSSDFRLSMNFKEREREAEDADARGRIAAQHSHVIAMLQVKKGFWIQSIAFGAHQI